MVRGQCREGAESTRGAVAPATMWAEAASSEQEALLENSGGGFESNGLLEIDGLDPTGQALARSPGSSLHDQR